MKEKHRKFWGLAFAFALFALAFAPFGAKKAARAVKNEAAKARYTFLICGADKSASNTDVMMLASVDTEKRTLSVLQIPRDTFINPKSSGLGVTRVNAIYAAFLKKSAISGKEAKKEAMASLCQTLGDALCIEIDRYLLIDTAAFARIIDAVGGIECNVPFDMHYDDPAQNLHIHLEKGRQTLDGEGAEQFIRYRSGYATGDIGRVEARESFLREAFAQVKAKLTAASAARIACEVAGDVVTNADAGEIAYFAAMLYGIGDESTAIKTISGSAVQNPKTLAWVYYALNKRAALGDINEYIAGGTEISYECFDKKAIFTDDRYGENPYISEYYYSQIKTE